MILFLVTVRDRLRKVSPWPHVLNGGLPELTGIITHPSIDPGSGRIIDRDGYDKKHRPFAAA